MEHLTNEGLGERRRSRRRRVDTPVRLLSADRTVPIEGSVTNLGPAGMFVATDEVIASLMGKDTSARYEMIMEHAPQAEAEDLDV